MRVQALVRDRVIVIECGEGYQRVKWLAMVATQRYDDLLSVPAGGFGGVGKKHVPCGLEDETGRRIPPTKTVNRLPAPLAAAEGSSAEPRVRVLLLEDQHEGAKNGTSPFLTAVAAVPEMCLVSGPGLISCVPRHSATFTVYCRDNFSIPISNGGEDLSVQFTNDGGVSLRADVNDHDDGSYSVVYSLPKRGAYTVDITIDGDHVVGSPFECVAVDAELPPSLKWMRPSYSNGSPPGADDADMERMRAHQLSPTDALLLGDEFDVAWHLHCPNLKYTKYALMGQFSPPAPQCPPARVEYACALVGGRLFLHGGAKLEGPAASVGFEAHALDASGNQVVNDGANGAPDPHIDSALWILDVAARTWQQAQTKGALPPPLCGHDMACHASHLFLFGGRSGRSHESPTSADLFVLATGQMLWNRVPAAPAPGHSLPSGRWGHTLTTVGSRLFLFGGQTQTGELLAGPQVFDLGTRDWCAPPLTSSKPKPRRGHSACVWGKFLLVAMGTGSPDDAPSNAPPGTKGIGVLLNEVALIEFGSLLSKAKRPPGQADGEKLVCSTHASSALRSGHSLIISRQLLLLCGTGAEPIALPVVLVPNAHMLLQSEHTEVVVPQPANKLMGSYTVEAWVCTALTQPMNILCKTNNFGAKSEWSHQVRTYHLTLH
mmetsp:Transcript_40490/g.93825  ORF Transcript_40490/g.93825 Transcript_40490/m.93825 type:complete len:660 (-) Transcript_40490:973-2952(-)